LTVEATQLRVMPGDRPGFSQHPPDLPPTGAAARQSPAVNREETKAIPIAQRQPQGRIVERRQVLVQPPAAQSGSVIRSLQIDYTEIDRSIRRVPHEEMAQVKIPVIEALLMNAPR
jgi:hypothetical protein